MNPTEVYVFKLLPNLVTVPCGISRVEVVNNGPPWAQSYLRAC